MNKEENILMIVENVYKGDSRVRKEVESLLPHYNISIISVKGSAEKFIEKDGKITHFRIPVFSMPIIFKVLQSISSGIFTKFKYILEYVYFTCIVHILFVALFPLYRFRVVHVHNPPDTFFLIGAFLKLFPDKSFIYDHHDLSPELYLTRFKNKKDILYKLLMLFESLSCKFADAVIATNESYKKIEVFRHRIPEDKVFIVRNDPSKSAVNLNPHRKHDSHNKQIRILFLGSINPQDGVDHLLLALSYLRNNLYFNNFKCIIIGDGDSLFSCINMSNSLSLQDYVSFKGYIYDQKELTSQLNNCDICIEPAPPNPLNDHSTFIKIMEYMAACKPTVAYDLPESRYSLGNSGYLVEPGNVTQLSDALHNLCLNQNLRKDLGVLGSSRVTEQLNWENSSINLLKVYSKLTT